MPNGVLLEMHGESPSGRSAWQPPSQAAWHEGGRRRPKEADGAASDTGKMSLFFQGQNVRTTLSSRARTPTCRIDAPWIALFGSDFGDLNHFLTFCVTYL